MEREKPKPIYWKAIECGKNRRIGIKVFERHYTNQSGKQGRFYNFELGEIVPAREPTPERPYTTFYSVAVNRLTDVFELLLDIDRRYNDGRAGVELAQKLKPSGTPLEQDDIPF